MSFEHYYQSLGVQPLTYIMNIPDNKLAKLMYYLECVLTVVKYDIEERYYNYNNYSLLNKDEEKTLLKLVELFSPSNMTKLSLFIIDPELLPYGKDIEFYEKTNTNLGVNINSEVILEGRILKVLKIMVCKRAWLNEYYYVPLHEYELPKENSSSLKTESTSPPLQFKSNIVNTFHNNEISESRTSECEVRCRSCLGNFLFCVCIIVIIILVLISWYYEYFD